MIAKAKSNKPFGILILLTLIVCVFLTMMPIALADEPVEPEQYEQTQVPGDAVEEDMPEPELISVNTETESAVRLPLWVWIVIAGCSVVIIVLMSISIAKGVRKKV